MCFRLIVETDARSTGDSRPSCYFYLVMLCFYLCLMSLCLVMRRPSKILICICAMVLLVVFCVSILAHFQTAIIVCWGG